MGASGVSTTIAFSSISAAGVEAAVDFAFFFAILVDRNCGDRGK